MSIDIPTPPPQSLAALQATLPRIAAKPGLSVKTPAIGSVASVFLRRHGALDAAGLNAARRAGVGVGPLDGTRTRPRIIAENEPVSSPVYVLGLDDLAEGRGLTDARLTLWTHLLEDGDVDGPVAFAEVDANTWRFAAMTEGPKVGAFRAQVRTLQRDTAGSTGKHELATLRVPALYLEAVWLRAKDGGEDVVIPLDTALSPLPAGRRYSPSEFLAALRPIAQSRLAQASDDDTGGG